MATVDETTGSAPDVGAWALSRVGNALDALVDREIRRPLTVSDPSQAYGIDEFGRYYQRGQNGAPGMTARTMPGNTVLLGIGIILFVLLAKG